MSTLYYSVTLFIGVFATGLVLGHPINGNISVILQNVEVNLFVLKDGTTTRLVQESVAPPNSPALRPPCRTCDATYNLFQIDNQYLIPNQSTIYILTANSVATPAEVNIRNCNPLQLHSVQSDVIWVQCASKGSLFEVVELHRKDNVTWYRHGSQNIRAQNVSRNGLVLVKEKDGENVSFLYYGSRRRLERKGLKEFSSTGYSMLLCNAVEELFYVNDDLILIQCTLRDAMTETGLILFNTSDPSQSLTLFHRFYTDFVKVHVFEGYVVLLSRDTIIIRNVVKFTGIEQLIPVSSELSIQGVFIKLKDTIYFVCTGRKEIYIINIPRILAGNITAFHRIETSQDICTNITCSPLQYIHPLLFVPLKASTLAIYTLDPMKLHATTKVLTDHYRYFFTYSISDVDLNPRTNVLDLETPTEHNSDGPSNDGPSNGLIVGISVGVFFLILSVLVVTTLWYWYYKKHSSR